MRLGTLAVILVLLAAPLAGCLSGDDGGGEPVQKQQARVDQATGGIEGVVTDPAVQPIEEANVTIVGTEQTTTTASDGSYAFSNLEPGSYMLQFEAPGFVSTQQTTDVRADQASVIDVILTNKQLREPFTQRLEMNGFIECGVGWKQTVAEVVSPLLYDSAFAACAVPNLYSGGNTTNDRFLHRFELEPPIETVVYEMDWDEGDTAVTNPKLRSIMEVQGFINANGSRIMDTRDHAPIHVRLEAPQWDAISQNFTDRCNGDNGTEESEDWCGYSFRDAGWPMVLRVFATGGCVEAPVSGCLVLQQEFTHLVTAFYNQPAPEGYALVDQA